VRAHCRRRILLTLRIPLHRLSLKPRHQAPHYDASSVLVVGDELRPRPQHILHRIHKRARHPTRRRIHQHSRKPQSIAICLHLGYPHPLHGRVDSVQALRPPQTAPDHPLISAVVKPLRRQSQVTLSWRSQTFASLQSLPACVRFQVTMTRPGLSQEQSLLPQS
jgi:hypothetical protein